ncbi:MAG: hypothetical protein J5842_01950, partial [Lachnospiraceae bacterium]|nr:hypothetical protein [Lachnospiraceae bacterium]
MGKEKSRDKGKTNNKKSLRIVGILVLCIIGIILNFEAGWIVTKTEAPLYMDTVGTVMVASIGGYIPSITVGFLTNILKSIYNPTSAYFAFLNVLIALIASYLARSGWLKKWYKLIAAGCILAITSGILSAIMSYYLYGFATEGTSAQLALSLFETVGLPKLLSEIIANCAMEFLDKMLTVVIVFIINIGLPETIRDNYLFDGWQQTPLSPETLKQIRSIKIGDNKLSLRTKILLILILSLLCISIAATGISYYLYRENMIEEHTYLAQSVANLAASLVDPERVDEYLSDGEAAPGYKDVEKKLYELRESSPDIEFIYIYQIKIDGCHVVF